MRKGCYKDGAKSKTHSISLKSPIHQKAIDFQQTGAFRDRKRDRYKIEAKNAEMKQSHGFKKSKFLGLFGMKIQSYMTAFVVNAKRIIVLVEAEKEGNSPHQRTFLLISEFFILILEKRKPKFEFLMEIQTWVHLSRKIGYFFSGLLFGVGLF